MNTDTSNLTPDGYDLTIPQGVHDYLSKTPFASTEAIPLSGGTANYVFRLRLTNAYEGRDSLVLKHARPYVKSYRTLAFALERQDYEVEALRHVGDWLSPNSIVTVPKVHLFDKSSHVIIMDDTGADSIDLKTFMQRGKASLPMSQQIGSAIGEFLGGMHKWGRGNVDLLNAVRGNEQAKAMSSWVYYGRLVSTLKGLDNLPKLRDPVLEIGESDMEVVEKVAEETTKAMLDAQDSFVMGDFWPGNIMVSLNQKGDLEHLYILDWELTKAGLPGVEIGQFCAEIHMLRRFNPEVCQETATLVLEHFFKEYTRAGERDIEQSRRAFVHMGVHLSILGARVEWGEKEVTRQVVLEGLRMVVDGHEREAEDFFRLMIA
ncbi:hypothetical protein BYT27DRAFT_7099486 [Phlegmacium glaucopus]|nr:hypothetical protein BYT27DRAFT_7099486 [Phlegmacium glaucopus]